MSDKEKIKNAAKSFKDDLVTIALERGQGPNFEDEDLLLFKGVLRYMTDEELALFARAGYLTSQAVADFLAPRIAPLRLNERIMLGVKMNYWRIWAKIVEVPGLSHDEISEVRRTYKCS